MKKIKWLVFFSLIMVAKNTLAQTIEITGKVISAVDVENVNVINTTSHTYALTNIKGEFEIEVKLNDTIYFSSLLHKTKTMVVDEGIITLKTMVVNLDEQVNELNEVLVGKILTGDLRRDVGNIEGKPPINFYDLGIPGYTGRRLTQSERRLKQAGEFKPGMLLSIPMGGMPLDPLLNAISGRTKMLKNRVDLETRISLMNSIKGRLGEDFFAANPLDENLKVDFFYFCADDENFLKECKNQNDFQIFNFLKSKYDEYFKNINEVKN